MQKNARFMIKIFALLINFSNFATELINKTNKKRSMQKKKKIIINKLLLNEKIYI